MKSLTLRHVIFLLSIIGLIVCGSSGCRDESIDREAWITRGEATLKPFKQKLMGALMEGLKDGPEGAIDVCRVLAPEIAEEVSSPEIQVGRTSHRLRNERNAPREWIRPLLDEYVVNPDKLDPEVVRIDEDRVGYVEPIHVKTMCLGCHGSDLSPSIAARIDENYPGDQARGFEDGDFRGLFWVEFSGIE